MIEAIAFGVIISLVVVLVLEIARDIKKAVHGYQPDGHKKLDRSNPPRGN